MTISVQGKLNSFLVWGSHLCDGSFMFFSGTFLLILSPFGHLSIHAPRAALSWRSSRRTWDGEQVCENFPRENDILLLEAVILQANSGCLTHGLVRRRETTEVNGRGQICYFCSWRHLYLAFIITWKAESTPLCLEVRWSHKSVIASDDSHTVLSRGPEVGRTRDCVCSC